MENNNQKKPQLQIKIPSSRKLSISEKQERYQEKTHRNNYNSSLKKFSLHENPAIRNSSISKEEKKDLLPKIEKEGNKIKFPVKEEMSKKETIKTEESRKGYEIKFQEMKEKLLARKGGNLKL